MTVALRSDADVTNATAGTSVTVTKPTGTADGDVLIAYIAEIGTGSITAPAGWTLIGSHAASTVLTVAAYYKVAASEGASWTWTLGSSVSNIGWVGSFTGVNTSSPIVGSAATDGTTSAFADDVEFRPHGMLVQSGAAVGTASGSQLTLSSNLFTGIQQDGYTEAADYIDIQATLGTNKGAGTDIAMTAATYEAPWNLDRRGVDWGDRWLSTTTTGRVAWNVSLAPAVVAEFDGGLPDPTFEAAFGGDPDDPTTWSWTDVTTDVLESAGVVITSGRTSEGSVAQPTSIGMTFLSLTGDYHPDSPTGANWPNIKRGLPIRVTMPYGYSDTSLRGTAFARSFQPDWDPTTQWSVVRVDAAGRLARIRRDPPLRSPLFRSMSGTTAGDVVPHDYWPMEDGSNATRFASALTGRHAMTPGGSVDFAADTDHPGSDALPTFNSGSSAVGKVAPYASTSQWVVQWTMKVPSEPASETVYAEFRGTGTARTFRVSVEPGSPAIVWLKTYDSGGSLISGIGTDLLGTGAANPSESEFFGNWATYFVASAEDGSDYVAWFGMTLDDEFVGAGGSVETGDHGSITAVKPQAGNGASHGHYAVFVDPAFSYGTADTDDVAQNAAAALGWVDEPHPRRFLRVSREQSIPAAVSHLSPVPYTDDAMGVQGTTSVSGIYADVEGVNAGGFVHDAGGPQGEVILDRRAGRYNQVVAMTIDLDQAQLHPPYAPRLDDQRLRTTSTVTREGGSSATYTDDIGEGSYSDPVTLNLSSDDQAEQWAAWRVALGTETGLRYPQIAVNLRANPELVPEFCDLRIGDRIRVTNPPSQQAPDDIDLIVEGITERITGASWTATLHCSPYAPYVVGVWDDATLAKLDTTGSELHTAVNSSATSWDVATTSGPLWTTDNAEDGFDWYVGGERVTVTDVSASTITYGAVGTVSHGNNASVTPGLPASLAQGDLMVMVAAIRNSGSGVPNTPSGWTRWPTFQSTDNVQVFAKIAGASESGPTVTFSGGAANADTTAQIIRLAGKWHSAEFSLLSKASCLNASAQNITYPGLPKPQADNCLILYVGWKQDDWTSVASPGTEIAEPDTTTGDDQGIVWAYQIQTSRTSVPSGTFTVTGGVSAISRGAVMAIRCDYQTATVTRSVNGVSKSHAAGAEVRLWTPMRWAL